MASINIPELAEMDKKLDAILAVLQTIDTPFQTARKARREAQEAQPTETTPAEAQKPAEESQETPSVTRAEVTQKATTMSARSPELKKQIRAIVRQYSNKLTTVPEDKLPEVWDQLNALEGKA